MDEKKPLPPQHANPHVLLFSYPAQGHVNSMLKLAELLSLTSLHVTFLISEHNRWPVRYPAPDSPRFARYPCLRFETITIGPQENSDDQNHILASLSILDTTGPQLRALIASINNTSGGGGGSSNAPPPVTCMIADGVMDFAIDLAKEIEVPIIVFHTIAACCFWTQFCTTDVVESGELPTKGSDLDKLITSISGMEGIIRGRDLPSFFQVNDPKDLILHLLMRITRRAPEAHGVIFNTFEDLEGAALAQIRIHCPLVYTLGPLSALVKAKQDKQRNTLLPSNQSHQVEEETMRCMSWLDSQPSDSVIYVSFGSTGSMNEEEVLELYHGLMNSGCQFLWVIRPDSIRVDVGKESILEEVKRGTKERGYIMDWAPQEEALAHHAVGGFFTHSGWNSTLESITFGKPMICWPFYVDQRLNSRFVGEVWKLGVDMKDRCDRKTVERLVRDVMVDRRQEFRGSATKMAQLVKTCVEEGGSSCCSLDDLVSDIKSMSVRMQNMHS